MIQMNSWFCLSFLVIVSMFRFQGPVKSRVCTTCDANFNDCPGHFGYLKLALPVFNVGYFPTIIEILKCICKVLE